MNKNELVKQVLESCEGGASDMTHALCALGNGDMGAGIIKFWDVSKNRGIAQGVIFSSVFFSLGIGIGGVLLHKHYQNKLEDNEPKTTVAGITPATDIKNI